MGLGGDKTEDGKRAVGYKGGEEGGWRREPVSICAWWGGHLITLEGEVVRKEG